MSQQQISDLNLQLEKKRAILKDSAITSKLPDKGERIRLQVQELEQKILALKNGETFTVPKPIQSVEQKKPVNNVNKRTNNKPKNDTKMDMTSLQQDFSTKATIGEEFNAEQVMDQMFRTHISNEMKRAATQHDRQPNFLLKPSKPLQIEHELRNAYKPTAANHEDTLTSSSEQPQILTEQQIRLWKGKRGLEYEKKEGIAPRTIQVLDMNESIDLYRKHEKQMEELEEKRLMEHMHIPQAEDERDENMDQDEEEFEEQDY